MRAFVILGALGWIAAAPQDDPRLAMARTLQALRDTVGRSVVSIDVERKDAGGRRGGGTKGDYNSRPMEPVSGTVFSPDGYIVTTAFNLEGEIQRITVTTYDGRQYEGKRLGSNGELDVALLKIEAKDLPVLPRAKVEEAKVGDFVAIIGRSPDRYAPTVNQGILSALKRMDDTALQTDAEINYGNAGAPLVTLNGELLGIVSQVRPGTQWGQSGGVGFATKLKPIEKALTDLKKSKAVAREKANLPWTGIVPAEPKEGVKGVVIERIVPNSPAEEAGLEYGDVIRLVDGKRVKTLEEYRAALSQKKIGDEVELGVRRQSAKSELWDDLKVKVELREDPN
ncbi:MAG: trypsin-like peptidase domain-containing protein [Planctomycetes bacterium]|nr:trypsin-like peptidase domain-containing protein [Planctomycetota bacterium]